MKKVLMIIIVLFLMSQPVMAFSVNDILNDFKDIFSGFFKDNLVTGKSTLYCVEGERKCGDEIKECGGLPCSMECLGNVWTEKYCVEPTPLCEDKVCTALIVCNEGERRCGDSGECGGLPCSMECLGGVWVETYCVGSTPLCEDNVCTALSVCNEGERRCGDSLECGGYPCVVECIGNQFVEIQDCTEQCESGVCTTTSQPSCGDGVLDSLEECDYNGPIFRQVDCNTETNGALPLGNLLCTQQCTVSTSNCVLGDEDPECDISNPCDEGFICQNGICDEEDNGFGCEINEECDEGYICEDNECIQIQEGDETNDTGLLNRIPIVYAIGDQVIEVGESFEVEIIALDPEGEELDYYFENDLKIISNSIISCSLSGNILRCNGVGIGERTLKIIIFDGIDEVLTDVSINVLGEVLGNSPPVADAGGDKIGIPEKEIILDGSRSYDGDGHSLSYEWFENDNLIGDNKVVKKMFSKGTYNVKLLVTGSRGSMDEDIINVKIKDKKTCKNTNSIYVPEDTICDNNWPNGDGKEIQINNPGDSCDLIEVCSPELDPLIEEAISCCTTEDIITDPRKAAACNFAKDFTQDVQNCEANYLIKIFGGLKAGPMKGYFDVEMCCRGVKALCSDRETLYTAESVPEYLEGVKCSNTVLNNPSGMWVSNTDFSKNEIALADLPASVSINVIKSGTCTDYAIALVTLFRKLGYEETLVGETYDHVFSLLKFENDVKWHIIDVTGNNEGYVPGNVPYGYSYCENLLRCYNDNGEILCPPNKLIIGCEGVSEDIGRSSVKIVSGIKDIFNKFVDEIKR